MPLPLARLQERLNHEYWPWQLIYLPALPFALWHAVRTGHGAFFTNVNPAMDLGGFFGESKSAILRSLPEAWYPTTLVVEPGTPWSTVQERMSEAGLALPLVLKPDVGERGDGVALIDTAEELRRALSTTEHVQLLQRKVEWEHEYGLFVVKDPRSARTRLLSITGKAMLRVTGDGRHSVEELLRRTWRGSKQVERLRGYKQALLASVPAAGERVLVEPIGNHCRGTTFLDGNHLMAPALERAVSSIMTAVDGVYYGRLDVKARSDEDLQQGRFVVMELNGVTSEPGHIYDPSYSIFRCWRELLRHLAYLPQLSDALREQGHRPTPLRLLWRRYRLYFRSQERSFPGRSATRSTRSLNEE